ncbi:SNF7 family protein [Penicillium verhagenii]|uniref:SNF7 family protein n=1 Tax=Penicillium verhagenii TaxID=1562060 RepID=UPI0025451112|nr:SNF7 family protein [Penicillium verhagenii]KAJ5939430.1 SNF7 family protein [Penicillium verhagenii]
MGNTSSSQKISSQDRPLLNSSKAVVTDSQGILRAILDLKNQRDKLKQYRKRITVLTDRETEIAKECLAQNDRRRALLALRRKKYQESLLDKTDGQLAQLEQLASQVEFSLVQKDVLFGLQQGTEVLQAINKEMGGIEGVERLMGETEEARAYQEISQMLEGNLTNQDEDDVEEELEALRRETQINVAPELPNAPNNVLSTPEEVEAEVDEPTKSRTKTREPVLAA